MNSLHSKLLVGGGIMVVIGPFCGLFTTGIGDDARLFTTGQ